MKQTATTTLYIEVNAQFVFSLCLSPQCQNQYAPISNLGTMSDAISRPVQLRIICVRHDPLNCDCYTM